MEKRKGRNGSSDGPNNNDTKRPRRGGGGGRGGGGHHGHQNYRKNQPKRGGPGMLLTCEAGRENRCRGEGLDILRHYYYHGLMSGGEERASAGAHEAAANADQDNTDEGQTSSSTKDAAAPKEKKELSLEEEIAMLQDGASAEEVLLGGQPSAAPGAAGGGGNTDNNKIAAEGRRRARKSAPFAVYDTGCKGTVIVLCTLPDCQLVSTAVDDEEDVEKKQKETNKEEQDDDQKTDAAHEEKTDTDPKSAPWDPVDVVKQITNDLLASNNKEDGVDGAPTASAAAKDAPSSRFLTRMVPLQATCFASIDDIMKTAKTLLKKYLMPQVKERWLKQDEEEGSEKKKPTTFEIYFKRRFCSNVRRETVIEELGKLVGDLTEDEGSLIVDLSNPDFTIQIEVVRTLCGMSIVPRGRSFRKFNLIELRESGLRNNSKEDK